jgi:site-specific recombinase XerD
MDRGFVLTSPRSISETLSHLLPCFNVRPEFQVDVPKDVKKATKEIHSVEEAIDLYMQAFHQKFSSKMGRMQRRICLQSFYRYLVAEGHSMEVKELTLSDGQRYLDSLTNHYNSLPLSASQTKKYCSALRSFSRFLHDLGIVEENLFLTIKRT